MLSFVYRYHSYRRITWSSSVCNDGTSTIVHDYILYGRKCMKCFTFISFGLAYCKLVHLIIMIDLVGYVILVVKTSEDSLRLYGKLAKSI